MQQQLEFAGSVAATTGAADLQASDDPFARMLQTEPDRSNGGAGFGSGPFAGTPHPEKPQHGAAQKAAPTGNAADAVMPVTTAEAPMAAQPPAQPAGEPGYRQAAAAPVTEQLPAAAPLAAGSAEDFDGGFADFAAGPAFLADQWASSAAPQLPADAGGKLAAARAMAFANAVPPRAPESGTSSASVVRNAP